MFAELGWRTAQAPSSVPETVPSCDQMEWLSEHFEVIKFLDEVALAHLIEG